MRTPKNILKKYMSRKPFITSLALFFICSLALYLVFVILVFVAAPLFGVRGNDVGFPVGGIIIAGLIVIATGFCDVYYAIKAESRLGYLIWLLGIPLFMGLFAITPENYLLSLPPAMQVVTMYFYRLPLFAVVRAYSYLARDEKRRENN